ncbi:MAG: HlyD family secretion protein [Defluviitaleaceae bacterium]|nr:HlyD family secretion protein [Defluviitaleaceae bacterium]MCL2263246.1 HlyD family secretion protein [Defluviitaleaceae bacterium]
MKKLFCLVFLAGLLTACSSNVEPPTAAFAENRVIGGETAGALSVRGVVESVESRNVYSTLGFFIESVAVEVGDEVSEGQILAVLDIEDLELLIAQQRVELEVLRQMNEIIPPQRKTELETLRRMTTLAPQQQRAELDAARQSSQNAVRQSERMLEEAYTNLQNNTNIHILTAENALTGATLQLETIQADHERFTVLYEAGTLSRNEFELSETALYAATSAHAAATATLDATRLAAQNEVEMLRDNLSNAQIAANLAPFEMAVNMTAIDAASSLETMEHAVELELTNLSANLERTEIALRLLERQLEDSKITAPISGTVTTVAAREGAVGAGLMFIVEDTQNLRVITRLREYDINRIEQGMEVDITADATGNAVHTGVIGRINPAAIPNSPIVEFEVEILIPQQDAGLRIGMNTRVAIDNLNR